MIFVYRDLVPEMQGIKGSKIVWWENFRDSILVLYHIINTIHYTMCKSTWHNKNEEAQKSKADKPGYFSCSFFWNFFHFVIFHKMLSSASIIILCVMLRVPVPIWWWYTLPFQSFLLIPTVPNIIECLFINVHDYYYTVVFYQFLSNMPSTLYTLLIIFYFLSCHGIILYRCGDMR